LAWLPLLLLFLEGAIRHRSWRRATAAGVVYGLMALGTQPQWTFYAGLFAALWTLGAALERAGFLDTDAGTESHDPAGKALLIWLLCGVWTAGLAVALAAVQLLPTLEAARWSTRAAGVASSDALRGGIQSLLFLVGPALRVDPPNLQWEDRGGFGLLWLSAAVAAVVLGSRRTRFEGAVAAVLFLFAFGGSAAVESLPGFNLFRQPSRMLMVATLPVALL